METEEKFYNVEFSIQGKRFPCIVRFFPGDRHWTCLYINKDNRNDWFIRKEVISQDLINHGIETTPEVYDMRLNIILTQLKVIK